ncbi:hypothetical protein [Dipodfec virus RodF1_13]|uniref:Uncharacterized protein n=1 Tax=Dipodfec virus RodF1_13 TaxID=2929291 RepID=A0A976N336_9VIRU|nr:hypothetical protein [Dipodfec virus RodF1_13]
MNSTFKASDFHELVQDDTLIYVVSYRDKELGVNKFFADYKSACMFALTVQPPVALSTVPTFKPADSVAFEDVK